jgi:1-acyl-sn-glycerol-3-phosphate acyltransferase
VFVSKSEVRGWPVIGWLTRCGGTLFVRRDQRGDVARLTSDFRSPIDAGVVVALFPEGTSSAGRLVLPFRSSLFEPAAAHQWPVTPFWLAYSASEGSVEEEVCYWGDMTFLPHLLRLLSIEQITATVSYGDPPPTARCRKELARALHREVCNLARREGGRLNRAGSVEEQALPG